LLLTQRAAAKGPGQEPVREPALAPEPVLAPGRVLAQEQALGPEPESELALALGRVLAQALSLAPEPVLALAVGGVCATLPSDVLPSDALPIQEYFRWTRVRQRRLAPHRRLRGRTHRRCPRMPRVRKRRRPTAMPPCVYSKSKTIALLSCAYRLWGLVAWWLRTGRSVSWLRGEAVSAGLQFDWKQNSDPGYAQQK
jgi:hypothetical protein